MKVLGLVLELNPPHNGHKYFIDEATKKVGPDYIVATISTSFCMRGLPSCIDKWQKAKIALELGVDYVFELPSINYLQNADAFCRSSVETLIKLGITDIAFGVELDRLDLLKKVVNIMDSTSYNLKLKDYMDKGSSYSSSSAKALLEITNDPELINSLMLPNNTLAIGYLKVLKDYPNINIVNDDIRKVDISQFTKIIGNLPYNITTELVVYILKNAKNAKKIVLMCQTEAFNHFYDVAGKEYGPASVLVHLLGNIYKVRNVAAGSFYPVPKCGSLVFGINLSDNVDKEKTFEVYKLAKQLFLNRRKTIYNNLSNCLKNRDLALSVCESCSIKQTSRSEDIPPLKYVEIYDFIKGRN